MSEITIPEGATLQEATRVSYDYSGSSSTGPFTIPFPFFETSDIHVYEDAVELTETTDYTVSGVAVDGGYSSGSITLVAAITSANIIITREVPFERLSDFSTSGPFPMPELNLTLDKQTAMLQQLRTYILRAIRLDDNDSTEEMILPDVASRLGKYLYFDPVDGSPSIATEILSGTTTISTYMETVLAAANAAIARALLFAASSTDLTTLEGTVTANEKGRLLDVQVYVANDTFTIPADTKTIEVTCVGGGGGGGYARNTNTTVPLAAAASGGAGGTFGYAVFGGGYSFPATAAVVVGAGGAGGIYSTLTSAVVGGTSSFTLDGTHLVSVPGGPAGFAASCTGGGGSEISMPQGVNGGAIATTAGVIETCSFKGGSSSNPVIGQFAGTSTWLTGIVSIGGASAMSRNYGPTSEVKTTGAALIAGHAGSVYGGGGGGAFKGYQAGAATASGLDGGDGAGGIVIVKAYG